MPPVPGVASPLRTCHVLVVDRITDALPALSVVLQQPEHRHLAGLARESTSAPRQPPERTDRGERVEVGCSTHRG
jgi:hypothetical protein